MKPVELSFELVELIGRHQPVGVAQLARMANVPKSTAQRTLLALQSTGWIDCIGVGRTTWRLTVRALVSGGRAVAHNGLRSLSLPVMDELRRAAEETVHLFLRFNDSTVLIERLDGIRPVRHVFPYGGSAPMHTTSSGKAVLARLSDGELSKYLQKPLARLTPTTVIDPDELRAELETVRVRGYAVTRGGHVQHVVGIGASICDQSGIPIAAVSVSAPSDRTPESALERVGPLVADAARRIELGWSMVPNFEV